MKFAIGTKNIKTHAQCFFANIGIKAHLATGTHASQSFLYFSFLAIVWNANPTYIQIAMERIIPTAFKAPNRAPKVPPKNDASTFFNLLCKS